MSVEATTAFKQHVYPVVTVVLVPGFVAAAPWVAGVIWPQLQMADTWEHATVPISITALGITLVSGFVLENLGSRLEIWWAAPNAAKSSGNIRIPISGEFAAYVVSLYGARRKLGRAPRC